MLDNSSLSDVSFANRFSQSVTCLLILLTLFCTEQQFFILMKSRLSMIAFMDHAFGVVPKKSLPNKRSFRSSPMWSARHVFRFQMRTLRDRGVKWFSKSLSSRGRKGQSRRVLNLHSTFCTAHLKVSLTQQLTLSVAHTIFLKQTVLSWEYNLPVWTVQIRSPKAP